MHDPKPALNANGSMTVEIWRDFKRHDMGTVDTDSKNFNQIPASFFITPPLWGIRDTAPYLHDGRAATLLDSILLHGGGDDTNSINAFKALSADNQSKLVEFLSSLGRLGGPASCAGERVGLSTARSSRSADSIDVGPRGQHHRMRARRGGRSSIALS